MPNDVKAQEKAAAEERIVLETETLYGDLRDAILDRLRNLPKPWTALSEGQQREWISGVEQVARHTVTTAVRIVSAQGRPTIVAEVDQITAKDGLKVVLKTSRQDENIVGLNRALGKSVLIVITDADSFMGEREPAKPDPDQPDLTPGGGGDVRRFKAKD